MKFGVFYPSTELETTPETVREFTQAVEAMGYDYILHGDHILGASHDRVPRMWGPYDDTDAFHDPFVLTSYMAAVSTRIGFATSVLILPQRQTTLVAKQAADVALLSGNRLRIGAGIGWNRVEYDALGQSFSSRGRRMDEQLVLLRDLWSSPIVSGSAGAEVVDRAALVPRPSAPVPIWIGGFAEAALRRGVRAGDGFTFAGMIDEVSRARARLTELLHTAGRDPDAFPTEFVMIPPAAPGEGRWPKQRPSFLDGLGETVTRWAAASGSHAGIVTYWMGLRGLDEHLAFAEEALTIARGTA